MYTCWYLVRQVPTMTSWQVHSKPASRYSDVMRLFIAYVLEVVIDIFFRWFLMKLVVNSNVVRWTYSSYGGTDVLLLQLLGCGTTFQLIWDKLILTLISLADSLRHFCFAVLGCWDCGALWLSAELPFLKFTCLLVCLWFNLGFTAFK